MKIAANPMPFLDIAPSAGAGGSNADYSRDFESTIRDVAKDSSKDVEARRDDQRSLKDEAEVLDTPAKATPRVADESADAKAVKGRGGKDAKEQPLAQDSVGETEDAEVDPLAALGRLLGGASMPVAAVKAVAADAQSSPDERVIVVSLDTGAAADAVEDPSAPDARGSKVKLEVVHMETHFEPRSDAFVLVEGSDAEGRILGAADEGGAPLSFDQALARLSQRKDALPAPTGEAAQAAAADVTAARSDVVVAADVTAQERGKERVRTKVVLDASVHAADEKSEEVEVQGASATRRKESLDLSTERNNVKLGRTASDTADAPKSGSPFVARDGAGTLPLASMTGQVAGRVIDALGATLASQRPSDLPSEAYLRMTAGGAALKTLTIQLQPETLGKLDVSMRLVDGQLTLEIAATEADTAKVLAQDREGLRKLLQHAGFSLDDASITIVTRDNSAQPQVRAAAASDMAGARQEAETGAGGDPRRNGESEPRRQGAGRDGRSPTHETGRSASSSADYV